MNTTTVLTIFAVLLFVALILLLLMTTVFWGTSDNRSYCEIFEHENSKKWRDLIARIDDFVYSSSIKDTAWHNDVGNNQKCHYFINKNDENERVILWEHKDGSYTSSLHIDNPRSCVLCDFDLKYSKQVANILYNTISEFKYVEDIHIYVKHDIDDADFKLALQYPNYEITEEMVDRLTKVDPAIKDYGDEYVGTVYALEWEDRVYYVEYCKNVDKWLIFTNIDNANTVADFYKNLKLILTN